MNKFTVIGFIEKTGQIACHHVIANNSMHAFAVVAAAEPEISMVVSFPGFVNEAGELTFPGEGIVGAETVMEQPEVFGLSPLSFSGVLEQVLDKARAAIAADPGLDKEIANIRNNQADWLEDLISNFADELDGIESEVVKGTPGSIVWTDEAGNLIRFMPSDALSQLRWLARQNGLNDTVSDQADKFVMQYGNKLDSLLTVVYTA